ncbi:hypothetical protein EV193_11371 [Herbihabitans rhizosphaerae]|uniref:Uncharacterized protein n=1 Tax=Herbihabitans rhizosphaerae TaxID=1872711 RepID=A0A4Q7KG74_9PSEU|nr:PPA1309 family protein [Herbihabitans rhizosphaerae]RZS32227.1 hypothetical protein EV193_11371 [Herbihabitans rhizosphaerae]
MLPSVVREVEEFVGSAGWDQPPQLFALVPTADLLAAQPELAGSLSDAPVTPVAQDALPDGDLDLALARIMWPDAVRGCALAQEIVVLPPEAEETIADEVGSDESMLRRIAAEHPRRREARLVAAVLRDGTAACVIRLRATDGTEVDQLVEHPELAPNLTDALLRTLRD